MFDKTTESILNGLADPIVLIDGKERIAFLNNPAIALFGGHVRGRHYATAIRQPPLLEAIDKVTRTHKAASARFVHGAAGSDATYATHVAPYDVPAEADAPGDRASAPAGAGLVLSFQDISQQEAASQIRRDFVANVSHELRTPLTALTGFIDTLQGAARNDAAARDRFLTIMQREAGRMNRLVEDLLSLSRVEADKQMRPPTRVDLVALTRAALATLGPVASEAGVRLVIDTAVQTLMVRGDADQLTQVLQNLVENAVKYGAQGRGTGEGEDGGNTVTLRIGTLAHEPVLRAPGAVLEVCDQGPGIAPLHLPRLTERFYRIDNHRSREMGGTGLGLAIVKHIVNRHRGRLRITSTPGQGSCFTVILPLD